MRSTNGRDPAARRGVRHARSSDFDVSLFRSELADRNRWLRCGFSADRRWLRHANIWCSSCVKCATSVERVVCSATRRFPVQLSAVSFCGSARLIDGNLRFKYLPPLPPTTPPVLQRRWSRRPQLIYLLHLVSINSLKSPVSSRLNT